MSSTTNGTKGNDNRKPFTISNDVPELFNEMAKVQYITSIEFCKLTSELFRAVFEDFEGTQFETSPQIGASISLLFNHGNYPEGARRACSSPIAATKESSKVIERIRANDRRNSEGDRYYLTEDGLDAISTLFIPQAYDNAGKPNLKRLVGEVIDKSVMNTWNYGTPTQYTKVSGISLEKLCRIIYGDKVEIDGVEHQVDYEVKNVGPLNNLPYNNQGIASNYMLHITMINVDGVKSMYQKLGISGGPQIIK